MPSNNNETTTKFLVDISELKKSMQEAKRQVAIANSEFKAVSSSMDDWTKSTDGLKAKLKQLDSNLSSQKSILSNLERQYELTVKEMGEGSKAADDLRIKINNQQAVVNKTEQEIRQYKDTLGQVSKAEETARKTGKDVTEVLDEMGKEATETGDGFTILKGAVAEFAGNIMTQLVSALKDGIAYLGSFSGEAQKAMNNFAAETGATADEVAEFKDAMVDIYNRNLGENFDDIAQSMAEVKKQAGDIGADELEEMTANALVLRDTFDFEVNESMRAAEMLMDQFGLTGTEAYNLIAQGAQNGLDKNGDLLDSINEYGVHYAQAGYTAEDFFNSLKNGTDAGTFSVDKLGDAMKEFGIRTKDTATSTTDAFKALGYGAAASQEDIDKTKDKIKDLEEKLAEATETQEELNKKSEELSKTNVQKHEQKISSLTDTIDNLEKQLKYANLEQENFNDKTSELTRIKNADKIAEYTKKLKEAKTQLKNLLIEQTDFTDSSNELAKSKNAEKIAEYAAEIEALKGTLNGLESSTGATAGSIAELQSRFAAGGEEARSATDEVLKKLFEMEDEVERNAVGVGLFGTMWEDLGADGIKALMDMNGEITLTNDALAQINSVKYNTVGEALTGIKRNLETSILMPIGDNILPKLNELANKFKAWVDDPATQAAIQDLSDQLVNFAENALDSIVNGVKWFLDNKDATIAGLVGIAAGFAAFKVAGLITSATNAIKGMAAAQWALTAAQKASVFGMIVAAIAALVAAFIYLWNNCEAFRNFWLGLWENIKNATGAAVESIGKFFTETVPNFFSGLIDWIKANWQSILLFLVNPFAGLFKYFYDNNKKFKEFVDTAINYLKQLPSKAATWLTKTISNVTQWRSNMTTKAKETGQNFLNNVVSFFKNLPSNISSWLSNAIDVVVTWGNNLAEKGKNAAKNLFNNIVDAIKGLPEKFVSIGSDIVSGLGRGFSNSISGLYSSIKSSLSGLVDKAKDALGINSPSKVFADEVGKWIPEGIAVGVKKNAKSALNSMRDLTTNAVNSARNGLSSVGGTSSSTGGVVNNFTQNNYSPKSLSRLEIYRQSKNLLGYAGGV